MMMTSAPMALPDKVEEGSFSPVCKEPKEKKEESELSSSSEKSVAEESSKSADKDDCLGKTFVKSKKKRKRRDHEASPLSPKAKL